MTRLPGQAPSHRARLFTILTHAALVQVLTFAIRPNLSYAVLHAGGSALLVGVITAAFAVPALLLALPAGHVVDRIGERPALLSGAGLLVLACIAAVFFSDSIALLVVATVAVGCGHLFSVVADQSMMARFPGRMKRDSLFGLYSFAAALGQMLGPLFLTLPGGTDSMPPVRLVFGACAVVAVMLFGLSLFMPSSPLTVTTEHAGLGRTAIELLKQPGIAQAIAASAIVLASVDLFLAYAPVLGHERHFTAEIVSLMLVARSLMAMVSRLFLTQLIMLMGRRALLVGTITLSALSLWCFMLPMPEVWFVVVSAIYGLAIGTCQPITMAWVSHLAPARAQALAMSLRVASNRAGQTILPAVLGAIAVFTGVGGVFGLTGVALLGAAWAGLSVRNRAAPDAAE